MTTEERYYATGQAAELLGISSQRVLKLCKAGKLLGAYWDAGLKEMWRIPLEDIMKRKGEAKSIKINFYSFLRCSQLMWG